MCQWHVRMIKCTYVHMCIYVMSNAASLHSALCVMQLNVVLHEVGAAAEIGHTRDHISLQWPLMNKRHQESEEYTQTFIRGVNGPLPSMSIYQT